MSESLTVQLEKAAASSSEDDQTTRFTNILVSAATAGNYSQLDEALQFVLGEKVQSVQVAKQAISQLIATIKVLPASQFQIAGGWVLNALKNFRGHYDKDDFELRNAMFESFLQGGQYRDSALVLSGVFMDSVSFPLSDEEKADILIKCAECFLVIDESVDAETFVTRASVVINNVPSASAVSLRFRTIFARVLDANRKFLDAALRYYELSTTSGFQIAREDLFALLAKAIACVVLGKGCAQRDRIVGLLSKDSRLADLQQISDYRPHVSILEKINKKQIIKPEEFAAFEACLLPHHKAIAAHGLTIPQRTLLEHNMLAVSAVYDNIRTDDLARILQVDTRSAEKLAAKMIIDKTLSGFIDQEAGYVDFTAGQSGNPAAEAWNNSIKIVCQSVSDCAEMAQIKFPDLTL